MKMIVKLYLIVAFFLFAFTLEAQTNKKYKIQLLDNDGNPVEFFLTSNKKKLLRSNSEGVLILTRYQQKKYKDEKFTLHFQNHLAYLVYKLNLYTEKGNKTSDVYIKYNNITIEELTRYQTNVFFLRRKEIRLD